MGTMNKISSFFNASSTFDLNNNKLRSPGNKYDELCLLNKLDEQIKRGFNSELQLNVFNPVPSVPSKCYELEKISIKHKIWTSMRLPRKNKGTFTSEQYLGLKYAHCLGWNDSPFARVTRLRSEIIFHQYIGK